MSYHNGDFVTSKTFESGLDRVCELVTVKVDNVKDGIDGVNARLDIVNGRLYKHESRISANEGRISAIDRIMQVPVAASRKAKIAVGTVGGVSVLAVLHSLFEMVRSVGPALFDLVRHK